MDTMTKLTYIFARTSTLLCSLTHAFSLQSIALPLCVKMRPFFFPKEIINVDDIRENETYDRIIGVAEKYINETKEAYGVGNRDFIMCSSQVEHDFFPDFLVNQDQTIGKLLDSGIRTALYIGMFDSGSHWIGALEMTRGIRWVNQSQFNNASEHPWRIEGHHFANITQSGLLSFIKLFDAGHLSPMNQPYYTLKMLQTLIQQSTCLLYTSDAADDTPCVDLGGRRIIKKKKNKHKIITRQLQMT
eukprot:TRINITY_DN6815_c0_g1_i4.p2 TRINITY_DN6815_c0_g1~~TRINITY_DN6815_c0_g1_i4.p2  ORF type:complete len:245 (-),score=30.24 TRINITY_DN6815_c0_g1_i4:67-801(-)